MTGAFTPIKMHDDEFEIDEALARRLLAAQFPQWSELPLARIESTGTVNAIFRLGDDMAVRLPRTPRWHDIDYEIGLLTRFAARLPLTIPDALGVGEPEAGYPWKWGVFRWLEGQTFSLDDVDEREAARQLAEFVLALQAIDTVGGLRSSRGGRRAMVAVDQSVRAAADASRALIDYDAFIERWDEVRQAPGWSGEPVWTHRDLLSSNILTIDGRLSAVIDWAGASVGDPAVDLKAAWMLFDHRGRDVFRGALPFDDAAWMRARAWALVGIHGVAYYAETNPLFSAAAIRTIERVLAD